MPHDVVSTDTRVTRLIAAYSLCEEAHESQLILSSRVTRAMLYAAITFYYSVAEREVLGDALTNTPDGLMICTRPGLKIEELLDVYERLKKVRDKAIAHVTETSEAYSLTQQADWYKAPPAMDRLLQAETGVAARVHIALKLPDISPEDREALRYLTAATADIYYQLHKLGMLTSRGDPEEDMKTYQTSAHIYAPDDTPVEGEAVKVALLRIGLDGKSVVEWEKTQTTDSTGLAVFNLRPTANYKGQTIYSVTLRGQPIGAPKEK